jgi:hypothetical protein
MGCSHQVRWTIHWGPVGTDGSPGSSHVGVLMLANSAGSRVDFTTQVMIVATTPGSDTEFRQAVRAIRIGEPCGTQ